MKYTAIKDTYFLGTTTASKNMQSSKYGQLTVYEVEPGGNILIFLLSVANRCLILFQRCSHTSAIKRNGSLNCVYSREIKDTYEKRPVLQQYRTTYLPPSVCFCVLGLACPRVNDSFLPNLLIRHR